MLSMSSDVFQTTRDTAVIQTAAEQAPGPSESCFLNLSNKDSECLDWKCSNRACFHVPLPCGTDFCSKRRVAQGDPVGSAAHLLGLKVERLTRRLPQVRLCHEGQPTQRLLIFTTEQFGFFCFFFSKK